MPAFAKSSPEPRDFAESFGFERQQLHADIPDRSARSVSECPASDCLCTDKLFTHSLQALTQKQWRALNTHVGGSVEQDLLILAAA